MHDASPPRPRIVAFVAAFLAVSAGAGRIASADDEEAAYFSRRFGGRIERVAVGPDGTIYVAGRTSATDLPASTSSPDLGSDSNGPKSAYFAAALEADGSPRWTSYLTGEPTSYGGLVAGISAGVDGSVWFAGHGYVDAVSTLQSGRGGWSDAIVAKFAADGTLLFASNLGGGSTDEATGIAVMPDGDAIVVGTTHSLDFPPAPRPPEVTQATVDTFVSRIRADGSGIVWTRRFGNDEGRFDSGGIALDPSDGTLLVGMVGAPNGVRSPFASVLLPPPADRPRRFAPARDPLVVRLDGDGVQLEGALLRGLYSYWGSNAVPVAFGADGRILAGGVLGVARTTPELFLEMTDAWIHKWRDSMVTRICPLPSGRVVVAERENSGYGPWMQIFVFGSSLADGPAPLDWTTELGFEPRDVAVDAAGALIVVGTGEGVPFNAHSGAQTRKTGCIARVPLDGIRAPTRLRARVAGTREVDVAWSRNGDAADAYDIERVGPDGSAVVLARVSGDVFRHRLTGLTPGERYDLRVAAVFRSGVRTATPLLTVATAPEPSLAVVAQGGAARTVNIRIESANGAASRWRLQRRFGDGPWMETGLLGVYPAPNREVGRWLDVPEAIDVVPDVAVPVTYRVQARLFGRRSAWIESTPYIPLSSLRVTQTRGHLGVPTSDGVDLEIAGTLAAVGPAPLSFDPAKDDFHLLFGPASAPTEFIAPHGYPGWALSDGRYVWSASGALTSFGNASEIVLDFGRGEFRVRLVANYASDVPTTEVAVNLAFGAFSGGDVKSWRGRTGWAGTLRFGGESAQGAGARAR